MTSIRHWFIISRLGEFQVIAIWTEAKQASVWGLDTLPNVHLLMIFHAGGAKSKVAQM
jgi:hypothetical protein